MELRYIGKSYNRRVNGRPMKNGDLLTNEREVNDLKDHPDFEQVGAATKQKTTKGDKKASK